MCDRTWMCATVRLTAAGSVWAQAILREGALRGQRLEAWQAWGQAASEESRVRCLGLMLGHVSAALDGGGV